MQSVRANLAAFAVAATTLLAGAQAAEEGTVKMMSPWESSGQLFKVGPNEVLFVGVGAGVLYIEDGEGDLDAAELVCPGTREVNTESGKTTAHGRCVITGATGDQVYGAYRCEGEEGACRGTFELTGGTGGFAGITGEGEILVRTSIAAVVTDAATGVAVSGAAGLAVWPSLSYKIP